MTDEEIFGPDHIAARLEAASLAFTASGTLAWSDAEWNAMAATAALHAMRPGFNGTCPGGGGEKKAGYRAPPPPGTND